MTSAMPGVTHHGVVDSGSNAHAHGKQVEQNPSGGSWYLSRRMIEDNSPSRRDGIDAKKEAYLRKSYCTFLQDLGMRLKVPQVTIATAILFCHRFFLRQSHAKNDRRTVATVCMFLAGKVEETPRPLKDVIIVSYEIIHKKDPVAIQKIKQREVYEQQKELILLAERVVLATLGFDLNVHHPYKPLVEAIKRLKVAQNALAQVAWNFVNDGLRTSLCLQFKPHHIATGAVFLAAKFLKVDLPIDGDRNWRQEFGVTPYQLEEVSNQMLELYEQNCAMPASTTNETEGNSPAVPSHRTTIKSQGSAEEPQGVKSRSQVTDQMQIDKQARITSDDKKFGSRGGKVSTAIQTDGNKDYRHHHDSGAVAEPSNCTAEYSSERHIENARKFEGNGKLGQLRPLSLSEGSKGNSSNLTEGSKGDSLNDTIKKIDKDKVKAALEKRRSVPREISRKVGVMDEDDLIERELESGLELSVEEEKFKHDTKHSWSKPLHRHEEPSCQDYIKGNVQQIPDLSNEGAEEGELSFEDHDVQSPEPGHKRKHQSPDREVDGKESCDSQSCHQYPNAKVPRHLEDSRSVHLERDYRPLG